MLSKWMLEEEFNRNFSQATARVTFKCLLQQQKIFRLWDLMSSVPKDMLNIKNIRSCLGSAGGCLGDVSGENRLDTAKANCQSFVHSNKFQ